ncbi:MAG: hypothetical protein GF313_12860 [Caldithrix sp.]|nr:hypothetical protein [Caldithrix sp.]
MMEKSMQPLQLRIRFLSVCVLFSGLLFSQETHNLTLPKCQQIATRNNYQLRTLQEDFRIAEYELKAAINRFKTNVELRLTAPDYSETISSLQDSTGTNYFPIKQASYSGNVRINQPLPTDGQVYISSGVYRIEDYYKNEQSTRLNTRIGLEQPIEALYAYNNIQSALRMARLNYELSSRRLTRARLDLNYQIAQAYYGLLQAFEREKIARQTLNLQEETYELARNKYRAGVIAEVEALQMEVDLGEAVNSYDLAVAARQEAANRLKQLLAIDLSDSLKVASELDYPVVTVNLDTALTYGLKNRLEIREREISREQSKIDIKSTKVRHQITGSISAYYDFIGVDQRADDFPLSHNFENAWQELKRRPGNRGVALTINIPLWDWGVNKARVQAAEARLRKARMALKEEKITVERDIRNSVNEVRSSLKRLQLLEKNVQVAERSFNISRERFANGDINSQALALDRNRLSQAYNSRLSALITYKLALSDLKRKTFYDFQGKREITGSSSPGM